MKTKIILLFIISLLLLTCKKNDKNNYGFSDLTTLSIQIAHHNYYGKICFTEIPVKFWPQTAYNNFSELSKSYDYKYLWDFGDGSFSTNKLPEHTFVKPGLFKTSLTIYLNNDSIKIDTTINVSIYPKIIEKTSATENGKFIYQTDDSCYAIVYDYTEGSTSHDWYVINYNNNGIVSKKDLELGLSPEVKKLIEVDDKFNPI